MTITRATSKLSIAALVLLAQTGLVAAHGFDDCTKEAKETWKSEKDAEAAAVAAGYTVTKVKVDGTCYEVYATDKDGKKFELFYNPVSLELMHKKDND